MTVAVHVIRGGGMELLDREAELAALDRVIGAAATGDGGVALVEGGGGMGKSRLLSHARESATNAGLRVLSARGGEMELEYPFGVVRQLFEAGVVEGHGASWLSGPAGDALAVFGRHVGGNADAGQVPLATLHGLYWLTVNAAAERPLMLVVDDVHWCDAPSLRFLAYLVRRLEGLPVLVALGTRAWQSPLLDEIAADPLSVSIRPGPLSEQSARELIRVALGQEPGSIFVAACHRAAGGNPLLLTELIRGLASEKVTPVDAHARAVEDVGPAAVSRTVLGRLRRLPGEAVPVARALAVLGSSASAQTVAGLTGLSQPVVAGAVGELVSADIVDPQPPLAFIHPLVRDAIYRDLTPAEREDEHEAAARLLVDAGAGAEQVGAQLMRLSPAGRPWVRDALRVAAREASTRGAFESTVGYLRRAAEESSHQDRRELLLELGIAEAATDAPAAAVSLQSVEKVTVDPLARAQVGELRARMLALIDPRESLVAAREAAAAVPAEAVDLSMALEALEAYAAEFTTRDSRIAARLQQRRLGVAGDGPGASMLRAVVAWNLAMNGGTAAECAALAQAAVSAPALRADRGRLLTPTPLLTRLIAAAVLVLADSEGVTGIFDDLLRAGFWSGAPHAMLGANVWQGLMWARRGELSEAEACLRTAIEVMSGWTAGGSRMTHAFGLLADVLIERGELDAAGEVLAARPADSGGEGEAGCRYAELKLMLARSRVEEALQAADAYREMFGAVVNPGWTAWRSARAQALFRLGRTTEARDQLEQELALARSWGTPGEVGHALAQVGTLRGTDGLEMLEEAVEVTEDTPAKLEHARALVALGSALRRARRPSNARAPLRLAHQLATRCGADPLAAHARAELEASGARPRNLALRGPGSLTPSERRVADLAAAGESNRAIAQQLYLSPKTVEVHLSSVYRKLDIRARSQLTTALAPMAES